MGNLVHREITIKVRWCDGATTVSNNDVGDGVERMFRDWEDDRYPYCVEEIQHGISQCIEGTLRQAITNEIKTGADKPIVLQEIVDKARVRGSEWEGVAPLGMRCVCVEESNGPL